MSWWLRSIGRWRTALQAVGQCSGCQWFLSRDSTVSLSLPWLGEVGVLGAWVPARTAAPCWSLTAWRHRAGGGGVLLLGLVHSGPLRLPYLPDQLQPDHQWRCKYEWRHLRRNDVKNDKKIKAIWWLFFFLNSIFKLWSHQIFQELKKKTLFKNCFQPFMNLLRRHFLRFELVWSPAWINNFLMLLLVAAGYYCYFFF